MLIQPTISLEMPVPSQGHYGFHSFQWDDDEVRFVLDQNAELEFYSTSSLKQLSTRTHYSDYK
jgi:hypothetical protein